MSTQPQRETVRGLRAAAGASYAAAAAAIIDAYVELAALDQICGSTSMSDHEGHYPRQPKSFLDRPREMPAFLRHEEFAEACPPMADLERLVELRVQALIHNELS